ncbi:MAG: cold shock domain-containing protein, partial [Cyanobacteria bacterium P01_F01_bin.3]
SSSVLKDTVDPIADSPDTHQRLDAAPASLPGGMLAAPSFPTEVSELISSPDSQPLALKDDPHDNLSVPAASPSTDEKQLPEIHDLLPAVEPDTHISAGDGDIEPAPDEAVLPVEQFSETGDTFSLIADSSPIEPAQRVSVAEQATLFSFEIVETSDLIERDSIESDPSETTNKVANVAINPNLQGISSSKDTIGKQAITDADQSVEDAQLNVGQPSQLGIPIVQSLIPDTLLDDLSEQKNDEPVGIDNEQIDAKSSDSQIATQQPNNVEESLTNEVSYDTASDNVQNPWLTAVPPQHREKREEQSQETVTKTGTVKLLFKLKPGNFHGYIAPDDGTKDILFHQKYINAEIFDHLDRGTQVVATAKFMAGKVYATRVDVLQQ